MRMLLRTMMAFAIAAGVMTPAQASRFVRVDLDHLVAVNETVVVGEAVEAHSYWNAGGTFIFTDVRIAVSDVLKGELSEREITVTLPGGTVGDLSTVIVGGAELVPGKAYVLFLRQKDVLGTRGIRTVPEHCQGVFEIEMGKGGLRAISQANGHQLMPDALGMAEAPGGREGVPFNTMIQSVRALVERERDGRREVK